VHNEELHKYTLPQLKEGKTGRECSMYWEIRNVYKILVRNPAGTKKNVGDTGIHGRITLKCILKKQDMRMGIDPAQALVNMIIKLWVL
jgi:hypothetical protein